ncbi:MAG: hypothetical protein AAB614_00250 [Patescibacteria group bacterium]
MILKNNQAGSYVVELDAYEGVVRGAKVLFIASNEKVVVRNISSVDNEVFIMVDTPKKFWRDCHKNLGQSFEPPEIVKVRKSDIYVLV